MIPSSGRFPEPLGSGSWRPKVDAFGFAKSVDNFLRKLSYYVRSPLVLGSLSRERDPRPRGSLPYGSYRTRVIPSESPSLPRNPSGFGATTYARVLLVACVPSGHMLLVVPSLRPARCCRLADLGFAQMPRGQSPLGVSLWRSQRPVVLDSWN